MNPALPALHRLLTERPCSVRVLIVAAHPDDEVIGAGAHLPHWREARFVHVTDGAPRNMNDAAAAGYATRAAYAAARRRELEAALRLAGFNLDRFHSLSVPDQEAALNLDFCMETLRRLLEELRPEAIVTHAYEGGHPDHDATAFAVRHACDLLARECLCAPELIEMTSYFNRAGIMATGEFLPCAGAPVTIVPLTEHQRAFKQKLFDCFITQRKVLAGFSIQHECFRPAPRYDFSRPPHDGPLYYERFFWGVTGPRWRDLAATAQLAVVSGRPPV